MSWTVSCGTKARCGLGMASPMEGGEIASIPPYAELVVTLGTQKRQGRPIEVF